MIIITSSISVMATAGRLSRFDYPVCQHFTLEAQFTRGACIVIADLTRQSILFNSSALFDGCPRNSGSPEFRKSKKRGKSGKPDSRCRARA